jgi:protease I
LKVLIMIGNEFEDSEFLYPYYRLQEAGYKVDVVGSKAKATYTGKHGVPFKADLSPEEVDVDAYAAVIIPGGKAPDSMRIDKGLVKIVKTAHENGKVIAAICHGPQMLIEADILRGRKATCWYSVATDLKNAGAIYVDAPVVVDGNLVTSRFPADLPQFCQETIKLLKKPG